MTRIIAHIAAFAAICLIPLFAQEPAGDADAPAEAPRFVRGNAGAAPQTDLVSSSSLSRSKRQAHVELDEATRTLIITTDPTTNNQIQQVLMALDKPVPQALIKVLFLEVTHSDDLDLGVDLTVTSTDHNGQTTISSLFGTSSQTTGGIVSILQSDLQATLRAISEVGKLNVLSRPSILARNNEEATITIGQEVPFVRNSRVTTDGQIINTVEYEDIGIILTVTPNISEDGLIELDVAPEISTLTDSTVAVSDTVNAPIIAKRSAETHVVVPSGKTVVIGGLMEDQETTTVRKVPVLGDIPLLGALFRRKIVSKSKTELLIFLTPVMVDSGASLVNLSQEETARHKVIQRDTPPDKLNQYLPDNNLENSAPETDQ